MQERKYFIEISKEKREKSFNDLMKRLDEEMTRRGRLKNQSQRSKSQAEVTTAQTLTEPQGK